MVRSTMAMAGLPGSGLQENKEGGMPHDKPQQIAVLTGNHRAALFICCNSALPW
jgi:hypothetical protein